MKPFYVTNSETIKQLPIYLTTCDLEYKELGIHRPHGFPDHQWILTIQGSGLLYYDGQIHTLEANTLLFIPAHTPHGYQPSSNLPWITQWVSFYGHDLEDLMVLWGLNQMKFISLGHMSSIPLIMKKIYGYCEQDYLQHATEISVLLYELLEKGRAVIKSEDEGKDYVSNASTKAMIEKLELYVQENYGHAITLESLAGHIGVTPQYVCRLFKKTFHTRPMEYINRIRIHKSKDLLAQGKQSVYVIAKAVGFHDASYFGAVFKHYEAMSPATFRRLHRRF